MTSLSTLALAVALAAAAPEGTKTVEKTAKLEGEDALLDLNVADYDVTFTKVQVKHTPGAKAMVKLDKEPKAQWRPRISVDFSNSGNSKLNLVLTATLADEKGQEFLTCEDQTTVAPRTKSDYKVLCMAKPMALADWPKVSHVKFKGLVVPAETAMEKVYPLNAAKTLAEVKQKLGPITVDRVTIINQPSEAEIKEATEKNPNANCRPRVSLVLSNPTDEKVKVEIRVLVEDKEGTAYLTCERTDNLTPNKAKDDLTLCQGRPMKTMDWPNVSQVKVIVAIK